MGSSRHKDGLTDDLKVSCRSLNFNFLTNSRFVKKWGERNLHCRSKFNLDLYRVVRDFLGRSKCRFRSLFIVSYVIRLLRNYRLRAVTRECGCGMFHSI